MEDFDEAEEQNEEDLLELGDIFGNINLKVINSFLICDRTMCLTHCMSSLAKISKLKIISIIASNNCSRKIKTLLRST
jgi:hypothetical protein